MNVHMRKPWPQERFFDWAGSQEGRYEFDGFQPVAMTGGNANHNRINLNLHRRLESNLRGSGCSNFGPDLGISTVGEIIRYPDALIACTKVPGRARVAPDPIIVFEVVSPSSVRIDRIIKVGEYQAVGSIRRYVIAESEVIGLTVLEKQDDNSWRHTPLTEEGVLVLREVNVTIPVSQLYENVDLAETDATDPE
jgi:Uma2 family endonuclease